MLPQTINEKTLEYFDTLTIQQDTRNIVELIALYIGFLRDERQSAIHTLRNRGYILRRFLRFVQESDIHTIDGLELTHLKAYIASVARQGHSVSTINTHRRFVRWFLAWCEREQNIHIEFDYTRLEYTKEPDLDFTPLTRDIVAQVIARMPNRQDQLMTAVTFEAGLRITELATLKVENISNNTLRVYGKGNKKRISFITPALSRELRLYLIEKGRTSGYAFRPLNAGFGDRYSVCTLRDRIQKHFRAAGVSMWMHLLRHSFAVGMLERGCDMRTLQRLLGHENIATTMRYLKLADPYLEDQYLKYQAQTVIPVLDHEESISTY